MRSLADDLRGRSDGELVALLQARPDLAHPVPQDLSALAQRAGSPASIATRLRDYDELHLQVLLACALEEEPLTPGQLAAALAEGAAGDLSAADARQIVRTALETFRSDALLWGTPRRLHLVGSARDVMVPVNTGPYVAGIDPVVAEYVRRPDTVASLVAEMPGPARAALARLLDRPVVGTVANPRRLPDPQRSGVDWLLAHHLIVPFGADRVVVPAEVVQLVGSERPQPTIGSQRGDVADRAAAAATSPGGRAAGARPRFARPRELRVPRLLPPFPAREVNDPMRAEAGAVGTIVDVLHALEEVGHAWAAQPPTRLRSGGVAVRDVTRVARHVGAAEEVVCLLLEVAAAAGLLASDNRESATVLPTPAFDAWRAAAPPRRMAQLLLAWRAMPREIGTASGEGARPLSDELVAPHLPLLRRDVLAALARADGDWTDAEVVAALRWHAPRLDWVAREPDVQETLTQLRLLGLLVGGWLTPVGRALAGSAAPSDADQTETADDVLGGTDPDLGLSALAETLARTLPAEVESVVIQGDLTAVVPGLPSPELADLLRRVARTESRGVASVYRFSAESIRVALDNGGTAAALLAELGRFGAVPQPLAYLINDTARTHAALRVGSATAYVRCDDPAQLAAILADPRAAGLGLFTLSETVAGSEQPPEQLLEQLRGLGHHPVPDPGRGLKVAAVRRARVSRSQTKDAAMPAVTRAMAGAAVRVMRAADRHDPDALGGTGANASGQGRTGPVPGDASSVGPSAVGEDIRTRLAEAIRDEQAVVLQYASPSGVRTNAEVVPLGLAGGYLTALAVRDQRIETLSLARITGIFSSPT